MSGSTAHELTNPAVSHNGVVSTLLIEKFNGKVHEQFLKGENLRIHFAVEEVVGTNMVSNKYIGETALQIMVPGQSAEAKKTEYDKNALVIDTTILARNTVAHIQDVQGDIEGNKSKISKNQSKHLKRLEDKFIVQQLIFGSLSNSSTASDTDFVGSTNGPRSAPRVPGHGFSVNVDISDAQAGDPNTLLASMEFLMESMVRQEADRMDLGFLVTWESFYVLNDAERLVNKDYVNSLDVPVKDGFVLKGFNVPVIPTNRFPTSVTDADLLLLSNSNNDNRYTPTAAQLNAEAILFTSDALLMGNSISLQADIFWDKLSKSFFIDSWMAEGAIPDRWENVGVVSKGGSTNTTMGTRAKRKAKPTTVVT